MTDDDARWLARKAYEERGTSFRTTWDLYLKFYTVFLTVNVAGLALVVQHVEIQNRWPIVLAFGLQNLFSGVTAIMIGRYSGQVADEMEKLAKTMTDDEALTASPVPRNLGIYGGWGNFISHLTLITCWIAVLFVGG